jgi:hypothetical protein
MREHLKKHRHIVDLLLNVLYKQTYVRICADMPFVMGISISDFDSLLIFMNDKGWITGKYDDTGSRPVWIIRLSSDLRWLRLRHGLE